jgi:hypothetical protein
MAAASARDGAAIEANEADLNDADVAGAVALSPPQPARRVETENAPRETLI